MGANKPVTQTPEQVAEVASDLAKAAAELAAISEVMRSCDLNELQVTNYDQLRRAREYTERFALAAKMAIRKAREDRGDFATPIAEKSKGKK